MAISLKTTLRGTCPCGSEDIDYDEPRFEGENIFFPFTCTECKGKGKESYFMDYIESEVRHEAPDK